MRQGGVPRLGEGNSGLAKKTPKKTPSSNLRGRGELGLTSKSLNWLVLPERIELSGVS
jgi:hypothetical protein